MDDLVFRAEDLTLNQAQRVLDQINAGEGNVDKLQYGLRKWNHAYQVKTRRHLSILPGKSTDEVGQ
jgi:hypothetical protein